MINRKISYSQYRIFDAAYQLLFQQAIFTLAYKKIGN